MSPGRRLGISNTKFHNFKPLHLTFDLITVKSGSQFTKNGFRFIQNPVNREPLLRKCGSRFLTRYFSPCIHVLTSSSQLKIFPAAGSSVVLFLLIIITLLFYHSQLQEELMFHAHCANARCLFQQDKCYDIKYDTGDKSIQCNRKVDALKLWLMWKAKGNMGFDEEITRKFENARYDKLKYFLFT